MNKIWGYRILVLALLGAAGPSAVPSAPAASPQTTPAPDESDLIYGVLASEPAGASEA